MTEKKSKTVNIFAVLGFALLLLVAIWSTVQVVKFVPRMFGGESFKIPSISLGSDDKLKLTLSDLTVSSGDSIDISWKFNSKKEGVMSFSYGCEPGFHFRLPVDTGYTVLPCNAPYNIPSTDNSLTVIPVSDSNRYMDAALAITFTDPEGKSVREVANITVTNEEVANSPDTMDKTSKATSTTPASTKFEQRNTENKDLFTKIETIKSSTTTDTGDTGDTGEDTIINKSNTATRQPIRYITIPVTPYSNPAGTADLKLRILSVGAIDPYTGAFVPKGTVRTNERGAVQFDVTNTGDKASGNWTYSAELPTYPHYSYIGKVQSSLMPGARATITVAFDKLARGRGAVTVSVDPYNTVPEKNESNNSDTRYFSIY